MFTQEVWRTKLVFYLLQYWAGFCKSFSRYSFINIWFILMKFSCEYEIAFFVPKPNLIFVSLKAVTLIPWTENAQTTLSSVLKSAVFCSTGQRGTSLVVCHLNKYNRNCNTSWLAGSGNRLPCGKSFLSKALFTTKSRREKSYKHALIIRHQLITRRKYLNSVPLDTDCTAFLCGKSIILFFITV